jgi:signal transduction histidine kinase
MEQRPNSRFLLLFFDLVILTLCIAGVEQSHQKAWLGADLKVVDSPDGGETLVVDFVNGTDSPLRKGDRILGIGTYTIRHHVDAEQILDQYPIGAIQRITVLRGTERLTVRVTLTPYYSVYDLFVQSAAIVGFFFLGLFVKWRRPRDPASLQFHNLAIMVACVLAFTMGRFTIEPFGLGHFLRAVLPLSNAFIGSLLIHFALIFPRSHPLPRLAALLLHLPAAAVAVWGAIASVHATLPFDLSVAPAYYAALTAGKGMLGAGACASIVVFMIRYAHCKDSAYRKQIAWAMSGTVLGTTAFLLWQFGTSAYLQASLPEGILRIFRVIKPDEIVLNVSLLVTATFMAIGIVRYRIFNIELLIKRGTVYALVVAVLILVYAGVVTFTARLVGASSTTAYYLISIAALTFDLVLFMPTRGLMQRAIDRMFFRVEYDFRKSLRSISEQVLAGTLPEDVAGVLISGIAQVLHPRGIMVMVVQGADHLTVLGRIGFPRWRYSGLRVRDARLRKLPVQPLVFGNLVEPGMDVVWSDMAFARRYEIAIIYAIRSEGGSVVGLLVLGSKKSGLRFTLEDLDLIRSVTIQAGLQFERLILQRRLVIEHHETERLRELNRMKSYFVSGISHDLKTPLTSISMFTELLEDQLSDECGEARHSIDIIQGECGRLGRLIDNVLDFPRMEQGTSHFTMTNNDLNTLVMKAFEIMGYQLRIGGFTCHIALHPGPLSLLADADAILEALLNLISNAMKYSGASREIALQTSMNGRRCSVEVTDYGLGIRSEEIPHLFDPFFRSSEEKIQKVGGVGLGLSLVKHIVDAHRGRLDVTSTPGTGSTFRMNFDLLEE